MSDAETANRQTDGGLRASYAAVPYLTQARRRTHPTRIAALASLFGLDPAPCAGARIVELGCGTGENLAAIAAALPEANCVGIDLVPENITQARHLAEAAGLKNLFFEVGDVRSLAAVHGAFDYAIAHGLFSWVTSETQDAFLRACRGAIAPHGVVYVSYNTYPGWHQRAVIRDAMLSAASGIADEAERVRRGRQAIEAMVEALGTAEVPYAQALREQRDNVRKLADGHIAHDLMEANNNPVYFRNFVERAERAGLRYVCEAALEWMVADNYPAGVRDLLSKEPDLLKREQLLDFMINRTFRESLLCGPQATPLVSPQPQRLASLWVSGTLKPEIPNVDLEAPGRTLFVGAGNVRVAIDGAISKAAILCLADIYPEAVMLPELVERARAKLGKTSVAPSEIVDVTRLIYAGYSKGLLDLTTAAPRVARTPGERPAASVLARAQLATGTIVGNLLVDNVNVDDALCRNLMPLLDGTRTRDQLAREVSADDAAIEDALKRLVSVGLIVS
ncbi:MAG: methyltransferase domain-containing protein [Alphaproteobacteria bacterium]|nr:methyltransferase domain-containing protein [Alphaproteobacteria bacterium]